MDTSNNVIIFPNSPIRNEVQSVEDVNERIELIRLYHIEESIEAITHILFGNLDLAGFDFSNDDDETLKEVVFMTESIKSALCKKYNIYHPFQKIKENIFTDTENGFKIVDSLNIKNLANEDERIAQ